MLLKRGVLVYSAKKNEEDDFAEHSGEGNYQFNFVGIAVLGSIVLVVLPKYCIEDEVSDAKLGQILKVVRKYGGSYSSIAAASELGANRNDRIALVLRLLEMYGEYGEYSNFVHVYKDNGNGAINWERTISRHQPIVSAGVPVYFEYETNESVKDVTDFVTRLYNCVLTECSKAIVNIGIADLLGIDELELSEEKLEDFGDAAHIGRRLDQELSVQFVTWKREVIELLKRYVCEDDDNVRDWGSFCLGNTSFYEVWEDACQIAFGDLLQQPLSRLGIEIQGEYQNKVHQKLIEIIPRPEWYAARGDRDERCGKSATLIPDIVTIRRVREKMIFSILDAKYYCPRLGGSPEGVPGLESITKQFLYQNAYCDFVTAHGFDAVTNSFLVPSASSTIYRMGHVEFRGVIPSLGRPFSDRIEMWALPAERIWQCYLNSEQLEGRDLDDILDVCLADDSLTHEQVSILDLLSE